MNVHRIASPAVLVAGLVFATAASVATAQRRPRAPAAGWVPMGELALNASPSYRSTANADQRALLQTVWSAELSRVPRFADGQPGPAYFLFTPLDQVGGGRRVLLSLMTQEVGVCEPAPNGAAGAQQMYWKCPLRVTLLRNNLPAASRDLPGYCMLFGMGIEPGTPYAKNHNEVAYDAGSGTVFFRVIQHGRVVPECSRSVHLGRS